MQMSIETAKMSERGQMILPIEIREEINATAGTIFAVSVIDPETVVMKKIDTEQLVEEFKRLRGRTRKLSPAKIEAEIHASRGS